MSGLFLFLKNMEANWGESLRTKLDQYYSWPSLYIFKFIVPKEKVGEVIKLFPKHESSLKNSTNAKYTSVTVQMMAPSSEVVIEMYDAVSGIEGIIAL